MKNVLVIFIIAVTILSVTIPLNSVYAQEVIGDIPDDPFGDSDIVTEKWFLIWVIYFHGLILILVFTIVIIYRRFVRISPSEE